MADRVSPPTVPGVSGVPGAFNPAIDRRIPVFHWAGFLALLSRELLRVRKLLAMVVIGPAVMAVIYFLCFAFGLGDQRGTPAGDAVLTFLVPGLIMLSVLLKAAENPTFSLLYIKIEGVVTDQLMSPLSARETIPAYAIAGTVSGLAAGIGIWLCTLLLWPLAVAHPLVALLFAALGALVMALAGLLVAIASQKWDHMAAAFTFLFMPISFLSGVFAPIDGMHPALKAVVLANPVYYAIDGFRFGMLGTSQTGPWTSLAVLLLAVAVLYSLTAWLYRTGWRMKG
ncbi:MAG: hypothetical protein RLY86_585 [Pseudomonadota bacterium]|jgi:ABC-2 type transport system permease protein